MKIQTMSDLHFEFYRDRGEEFLRLLPSTGADVLVLPGDILSAHHGSANAKNILGNFCARFAHVVYVPGNHEYYSSNATMADETIRSWPKTLELPNLHILREGQEPLEIAGQRFLGDTLWFRSKPDNVVHRGGMNDFRAIKSFEPWVYFRNEKAVEYLNARVRPDDIVVTHHLPSFLSVPPRYAKSPLNAFFVNDMESLIVERRPKLWLHGHTHTPCDYRIAETRIVANPLGYPGEGGLDFRDDLVLEV